MNDPWADVRKKRNRRYMKTPWTDPEIDRLLADANALLAAVRDSQSRAVTDWEDAARPTPGSAHNAVLTEVGTFEEWLEENEPNLAALPEHLRGDSNERSGKA